MTWVIAFCIKCNSPGRVKLNSDGDIVEYHFTCKCPKNL